MSNVFLGVSHYTFTVQRNTDVIPSGVTSVRHDLFLDLMSSGLTVRHPHPKRGQELGAQVLSVLIRNARLFQRLVSTEDYEVPSCGGEASGERGGDGVVGVSASKSVTTVVTEATAPPSPPSRISKDSKHRRLGEERFTWENGVCNLSLAASSRSSSTFKFMLVLCCRVSCDLQVVAAAAAGMAIEEAAARREGRG